MASTPLPLPPVPPPDEWTARKQQFDDLLKTFSATLGTVVALIAILTAVGYVIVHLYLAQFTRIHGYNLNTSQYLAASVGMVIFFALLATPVLTIYHAATSAPRRQVLVATVALAILVLAVVFVVVVIPLLQSLPQSSQPNDVGGALLTILFGIILPLLPRILNSGLFKSTPKMPGLGSTTTYTPYVGTTANPFSGVGSVSVNPPTAPAAPTVPLAANPLPGLAAALNAPATHTVSTPAAASDRFEAPRGLTILIVLAVFAASVYLYGTSVYRAIPHYLGGGGAIPITLIFKPQTDVSSFGLTPIPAKPGYSEHLLLLAELTDGILVYDPATTHSIAIRNDSLLGFIDDSTSATPTVTPTAQAPANP